MTARPLHEAHVVDREPVLDGVRALAILWLIAFHTVWIAGLRAGATPAAVAGLYASAALRPLLRGDLGVDLFFVLSGYLITRMLLRELASTGHVAIWQFQARRIARIAPLYLMTLPLVFVASSDETRPWFWANLIALNNYVPVRSEFMTWAWSLAIELQFYLVAPIIAAWFASRRHPRAGGYALAAGLAASVAIRITVAAVRHMHTIVPHPVLDRDAAAAYFDALYQPTHARFGALLIGVVVAREANSGRFGQWQRQRRVVARCLAALSALVIAGIVALPAGGPTSVPDAVGVAYVALHPMLFAAAAGYLLASWALDDSPLRWSKRLLALGVWSPIARWSYAAYLVHPLVIGAAYYGTPGRVPHPAALVEASVVFAGISLAIAAALTRWVDGPARRWLETALVLPQRTS